jgi:hypothetical protein
MTISIRNYPKDFRTQNISRAAQEPIHIQPTKKPLRTMQTKNTLPYSGKISKKPSLKQRKLFKEIILLYHRNYPACIKLTEADCSPFRTSTDITFNLLKPTGYVINQQV